MTNINQPLLESGRIIPAFTLPGTDGMPHSLWDYKQRQHLILLSTHKTSSSETRGILRAFAKVYSAIREEQCSILAISPDTVIANLHSQDELHLPYPLLADPKGEVPSDRFDKGMRNKRVQLRSMYPGELQQTGKIEGIIL